MAMKSDGTEIPHDEAVRAWAQVAYDELKRVAQRYNAVISYAELREVLKEKTGITTGMLLQNWIGPVLEIAAQKSADKGEPPLTALCVRSDRTIGEGYAGAPKFEGASMATDVEVRAAEDRLLCYREFALDLPPDGGSATVLPQVALTRRQRSNDQWLDELIEKGALSLHDHVPFDNHLQVAKLFGRDLKGHQRATIRLDEVTDVWFPKLYPNDDWDNALSPGGAVLSMRPVPGGKYGQVMESKPIREYRVTFGHVKPSTGRNYYEFLGVFEGVPERSDASKQEYERVSDLVTFDGTGDFSFEPIRSRPLHDDLSAEAADQDPRLVAEFQRQLDNGSFTVEDQRGNSKVRGSAQAVFAKAVKSNYGWECAVTGIKSREFLIASHIVPWSEDKDFRLDPSNGICLSTFVDRAFDAGYLSITADGRTTVHWGKVVDDPILKVELTKIDDVELKKPTAGQPNPAHVARRLALGA